MTDMDAARAEARAINAHADAMFNRGVESAQGVDEDSFVAGWEAALAAREAETEVRIGQALAFAVNERDSIRGQYAQTGGAPARYLGYADACDDLIALLHGDGKHLIPTPDEEGTDE